MLILMPTCNRAEMALSNTKKLKGADKIVLCVNNCDIKEYYKYKWPSNVFIYNLTHISGDPKECHNKVFRIMLQMKFDLNILILEDDCTPCDGFINKFKLMVGRVQEKDFTMSPIFIPEKKCNYTDAPYEDHEVYFRQKYVDGNFYITKGVHKLMKEWAKVNVDVRKSSSGIGIYFSKKIHAEGFKMYCVKETMVEHGDHESLQFGERRKLIPLIAKFSENV